MLSFFIVPFSFIIGGLYALSEIYEEYKPAKKFIEKILCFIGTIIIIHLVYNVFKDYKNLFTIENLLNFLLPLFLSVLFFPFICSVFLFLKYETIFKKLNKIIKDKELRLKINLCLLLQFNLRYYLLERWYNLIVNRDINNFDQVRSYVILAKELNGLEKKLPEINSNNGWSPYTAKKFLNEADLITGYYHPCYDSDEWWSFSSIEIGNASLQNSVEYYIYGKKEAATRLKLKIIVFKDYDQEIKVKFISIVKLLFSKSVSKELPNRVIKSISNLENLKLDIGNYTVVLNKKKLNDVNGFTYKFEIMVKN